MFRWLKDARYADVQIELKQLKAEIDLIHSKIETMQTHMNSLRGFVNRKTGKWRNEEEEEENPLNDIEAIKRAFGGDLPVELKGLYSGKT